VSHKKFWFFFRNSIFLQYDLERICKKLFHLFAKRPDCLAGIFCGRVGPFAMAKNAARTAGNAHTAGYRPEPAFRFGYVAGTGKKTYKYEETPEGLEYEVSKKYDATAGALFSFDPNTLPAAGWEKLGLPQKTIRTLLNYRSKGGHFYKPDDLKKIWGLPDGFYERVQAYITIADAKKEATPGTNISKTPYEHNERTITPVDVNTADTTALIALPGIGSKLAQRIIAFRSKLGGFYSADQVGETYGLPDSTFQKLKPYFQVHGDFKKFNLNSASKDDLKIHPYIRWTLANAIVEYRSQHGDFKKLDELKNIMLIDDATYNKILPYLTL
jgi:competence protein ComEA